VTVAMKMVIDRHMETHGYGKCDDGDGCDDEMWSSPKRVRWSRL
jgi:hypothetical protein